MQITVDEIVKAVALTVFCGSSVGTYWEVRGIRRNQERFITKEAHDELCSLKLCPMQKDIEELKTSLRRQEEEER
jgi:hypothetical protein